MSDLHPSPPDPPANGPSIPSAGPTSPPLLGPTSASAGAGAGATTSKRQRRPSVRLGEIGEQTVAAPDPFSRRSKQLKLPSSLGPTISSSKPRSQSHHHHLDPLPESPDDELRKPNPNPNPNPNKSRRTRRPRSIWTSASSKPPDDEEDEGFRSEFDDLRRDADDSLSPSDGGGRDWPADDENPNNGDLGIDEVGGVRSWLNRLGLGRYNPVFEIHEVDDEVLPLLTLEDLKDMGINAVGSRRKMFCAIQKLKKNFQTSKQLVWINHSDWKAYPCRKQYKERKSQVEICNKWD